eukprot:2997447-Prymnesium_polylepis.2
MVDHWRGEVRRRIQVLRPQFGSRGGRTQCMRQVERGDGGEALGSGVECGGVRDVAVEDMFLHVHQQPAAKGESVAGG